MIVSTTWRGLDIILNRYLASLGEKNVIIYHLHSSHYYTLKFKQDAYPFLTNTNETRHAWVLHSSTNLNFQIDVLVQSIIDYLSFLERQWTDKW